MKLLSLAAAGLVAMTGVASAAPASAQHRVVVRERTVVRHNAPRRWHNRRVCKMEWRNHRRVRICRTVRYR